MTFLENVFLRLLREAEGELDPNEEEALRDRPEPFRDLPPWAEDIATQIAHSNWAARNKIKLLGLKKMGEEDVLAREIVQQNLNTWKSIVDRYGEPRLFNSQGLMGLAFELGDEGKYVLKFAVAGEYGSDAAARFSEELFGQGLLASYSPMILKKGQMSVDRAAYANNTFGAKQIGDIPVIFNWHVLERVVSLSAESGGGFALDEIFSIMNAARTTHGGRKIKGLTQHLVDKIRSWPYFERRQSTIRADLEKQGVELQPDWVEDLAKLYDSFVAAGIGDDIKTDNVGWRPSTDRPVVFDF